jgi:hypothetical protein
MSAEAATQVVGAFGAQGGDGGKQLERLMAAAVKSGMESIDMGFFEKLATASAKGAYSSATGYVGAAQGAMMFAGMYRPNQYDVQERIGGIAAGDRLFTQNSYFRSRGMVDAARILGSGAEGAQVSALSGASFGELLGGKESERLRALGITPEQMKAYRDTRLNNLGDVLGGYKKIKGMVGGQSFSDFLRSLAADLKDPKKRRAAMEKLNTLSAYGGELTGEQFGDLRGALGAYGVSDKDIGAMLGGRGGMGDFARQGGLGAQIVSSQNRMQNEDLLGGTKSLKDVETSKKALEDYKFLNAMLKKDPEMVSKWTLNPEKYASDIKMRYQEFQGSTAAATTPGYESTQQLNEALGHTASYLNNEVAIALQNFVKNLGGDAGKPPEKPTLMRVKTAR